MLVRDRIKEVLAQYDVLPSNKEIAEVVMKDISPEEYEDALCEMLPYYVGTQVGVTHVTGLTYAAVKEALTEEFPTQYQSKSPTQYQSKPPKKVHHQPSSWVQSQQKHSPTLQPLLDQRYATPDGRKALANFTMDDLSFLIETYESRAAELKARQTAVVKLRSALEKHGVATVDDLDDAVIAQAFTGVAELVEV